MTQDGTPFQISTPDFVVTMIETEGGAVIRLTTDFYVSNQTTRQTGIEFHGDEGSLFMESWGEPGSRLQYARFGEPFEDIPLLGDTPNGSIRWGQGVYELVQAIEAGRAHRFSGEHAAHVTEILTAAARSMVEHGPVTVKSRFAVPEPMPWAL